MLKMNNMGNPHTSHTRKRSAFLVFNLMVVAGIALIMIYFSTRPGSEGDSTTSETDTAQAAVTAEAPTEIRNPPTQTPTSDTTLKYVVQQGDTLSAIAQDYGTAIEDIISLNGLENPNVLHIGQELIIPTSTSPEVQTADTVTIQESLPTPLPSPTLISPAIIEIAQVLGSGSLDTETVAVRNRGGEARLGGWTLTNEKGSTYILPQVTLFQNGQITIHSGAGENTPKELYWGRTQAAWSTGELLQLRNESGEVIDSYIIP
jgi:LysM repeat protein